MSGEKETRSRAQNQRKKGRRELKSPEARRFLPVWRDARQMVVDAGFKVPSPFLSDCPLDIPKTADEEKRLWILHVDRDGSPYLDIECW